MTGDQIPNIILKEPIYLPSMSLVIFVVFCPVRIYVDVYILYSFYYYGMSILCLKLMSFPILNGS